MSNHKNTKATSSIISEKIIFKEGEKFSTVKTKLNLAFPDERIERLLDIIPKNYTGPLVLVAVDCEKGISYDNIDSKISSNYIFKQGLKELSLLSDMDELDPYTQLKHVYSSTNLLDQKYITSFGLANILNNGLVLCYLKERFELALATRDVVLATKLFCNETVNNDYNFHEFLYAKKKQYYTEYIRNILNRRLDVLYFIGNSFCDNSQTLSLKNGILRTDNITKVIPIIK